MPPQVTRIVKRNRPIIAHVVVQLARSHQLRQQLRMVNDLPLRPPFIPAVLVILLADAVQTVRAGGHDALGRNLVQDIHIALRHSPEQVLPSRPARRVAGAALHRAQHREAHAGMVQHLRKGPRRLPRPRIIARRAPHPPQDLRIRLLIHRRRGQPLRPRQPFTRALVPRIALAFDPAVGLLQLPRKAVLGQRLVTPQVHDVEHRLVAHRADVDAGAAGRTRPHRGLADRVVQQRRRLPALRHRRRLLVNRIALVDLQRRRRQLLARHVCRTHILAAVAHDAGVGIHQMRPGQLLQPGRPEGLDGLVLKVQRRQLPQRAPLRPRQKVDARHDQVQMLCAREPRHKRQHQPQRHPPAQMLPHGQGRRAHPAPQQAHAIGERLPRLPVTRRLPGQRNSKALAQQPEPHVQQNEEPHQQRVPPNAPALHLLHQHYIFVIVQLLRARHKTPHQKIDHANQYPDRHHIRGKTVSRADGALAQKADREVALHQIAQVHQQIKDEAPGNQRMKEAGPGAAFPHVAERKPPARGLRQPARNLTRSRQLPRPPPHHVIDAPELDGAQVDRHRNRGQKDQLLRKSQHSSSHPLPCIAPRSVSLRRSAERRALHNYTHPHKVAQQTEPTYTSLTTDQQPLTSNHQPPATCSPDARNDNSRPQVRRRHGAPHAPGGPARRRPIR